MIAFLKTCLYLMLVYWVLDETGPVTVALFCLMLVDHGITSGKVKTVAGAVNAGVSTQVHELKRHLDKYDVGAKK